MPDYTAIDLRNIARAYIYYMNASIDSEGLDTKRDFDTALSSLGRKWLGNGEDDIDNFPPIQQVVIADIQGYDDWELKRDFHVKYVKRLRETAYNKMFLHLWEGK